MGFAITNSGVDIHSGGYTSGGSRQTIENDITKLQKQRDEYEQQKDTDDTAAIDEKIASLEKRINNLQQRLDKLKSKEEEKDSGECQTCKNRRYQDGSDDPGVSFKTAGKINPANAEAVVRSHEYEHVNRNQAKAAEDGKEIVYQSVIIKHGICPECGDSYVTGGQTTTVTRSAPDERYSVGMKDNESGKLLNVLA
ncbi:MAG: hypothetical protein J6A19_04825 [Oscillospiraceae bacterium]|nr:hypothetical protein [Oscillospiraceae bacterium]